VFYPEASNTVIFVIMAIVLLIARPACSAPRSRADRPPRPPSVRSPTGRRRNVLGHHAIASHHGRVFSRRSSVYPVFLMKVMCFALFACAFNLLLGFGGLLSFGHAMFLGTAGYVAAHAAKVWGLTPELAHAVCGTACAARWAG
jgi:branched-chain amino acid transport system permease protein